MRHRKPQPGDLSERLRCSCLGLVIQRLSVHLERQGYSRSTTHQYLAAIEHFARWLRGRDITHALIKRFVSRHLPSCRCKPHVMRNVNCVRAAMNRLREMLKISRPASCERLRVAAGVRSLLEEFEGHLRDVRGLAASTAHFRVSNAAAMLRAFRVHHPRQLRSVTAEMVTRFVSRRVRDRTFGGAGVTASATRLFLRYLLMRGYVTRDLTGVVLSPAQWRQAGLPPMLDEPAMERLVTACQPGTGSKASPVQLRDRSIVLCLVDLGLRASDVAALRLDGVDLPSRTLTLYQPKARHYSMTPMTPRLIAAIQAYLLARKRPGALTGSDRLFVKHRAPAGQPLAPSGIRNVVRRTACRAGLQEQITGTHIIRHAVASSLLRRGASIKHIADLLGHRSIDTTSIYAKVDLRALAAVAMPWPAGERGRREVVS